MPPTAIPSPPSGVVHLGPVPLRAYALFILVGVLVAVRLSQRRASRLGLRPDLIADLAFWVVPAGIVGARAYHVVTSPGAYFGRGGDPVASLFVWRGGLGIWGAVAGGAVAAWLFCRREGLPFLQLADIVAPGLAIAQAIGRIGNYFNQELFGGPTSLPWGLQIDAGRPGTVAGVRAYQPTFAYEMLWDLGVAGLCLWAEQRCRLRRGQTFALYVGGYTAGRGWIEALRSDPANTHFGVRLNDYVSGVVLLGALVVFCALRRRPVTAAAPTPDRLEPAVES